jgi:hypothetical protein
MQQNLLEVSCRLRYHAAAADKFVSVYVLTMKRAITLPLQAAKVMMIQWATWMGWDGAVAVLHQQIECLNEKRTG